MDGICVKDVGVDDRLAFLERCIVFRFVSSECIDWSSFRRWAHQNWASSLDVDFQKLGDGLWLLDCGSSEKVKHILALDRWCFGRTVIQLDRWIPVAGRSGVLLSDDVVWVTFRGIPLHLRSTALFRQLGDICGHFSASKRVTRSLLSGSTSD
ncbi:hypothetical protein LINPERHAP1_LOCUS30563 [Linum perenne]